MRGFKISALSMITTLFIAVIFSLTPQIARAGCDPLASDKGQSSSTLAVQTAGTYTLWARLLAPNAASNSIWAQIDANCPVVVGDTQTDSAFIWVKAGEYTLAAGNHTVTLAGRESGTGVDRVLVTDPSCTPTGFGDNCVSNVTTPTANTADPNVVTPEAAAQKAAAAIKWPYAPNWWLFGGSMAALVGAVAFALWRYRSFMKSMATDHTNFEVGSAIHPHANLWTKLGHFATHHRITVIVCGGVAVVAIIIGVVAAANVQPFFEAESGTLSGGATVTDNSNAAGGKYVLFSPNPTGSNAGGSGGAAGGTSNGGTGSTGGSGTSSGGGGTGSSGCALPKYPDATCTGVPAGVTLTAYTGPTTISTANTIIDGKLITDCIFINAPGVVIKNSRVNGSGCGSSTIQVNAASIYHGGFSGTGATIQDSEISCLTNISGGVATNGTAIGDNNVTVLRNNIYGCENGFDMDLNADIEDNYIHDLYQSDVAHTDGLQSADGTNLRLIHNTFYGDTPLCPNPNYCAGTSAININNCNPQSRTCPTTQNAVVQDNLLAGGAFTLYCPFVDTNFKVVNNHFSYKFRDPNSPRIYGPGVAAPWKPESGPGVGAYGPNSDCQDEAVITGNVYHETGLPVPFN